MSREPTGAPLLLATPCSYVLCLPDVRARLIAALDTIQPQASKGVKRKRDNDDNDDNDALKRLRRLLAQGYDDNDNDEDDNNSDNDDNNGNSNDNDNDNVNDNDNDETSWIDCWIDKPFGEGGRKNKEGRPGWGKPEILKTAGITEGQYNRYMVSFSSHFRR